MQLGLVNRRSMEQRAARLIEEHHFPSAGRTGSCRNSARRRSSLVEICRAIQAGPGLLIFDEPTSSLSESETKEVFRIVRELRERGTGVIYITHRLDELRSVGDRVTIFRDGEWVHTCALDELDTAQLIKHMVGREVTSIYSRQPVPPGPELLRVEGLSRKGVLHDISLQPARGRDRRPGGSGRRGTNRAVPGAVRCRPDRLRDGVRVEANLSICAIPDRR